MDDKKIFTYRISEFSSNLLNYLSEEMSQDKNTVLDSALIKYYEDLLNKNLIQNIDTYTETEREGINNLNYVYEYKSQEVTDMSVFYLYTLISRYDYNYEIPNWNVISQSDEYAILQYLIQHNGHDDNDNRLPELQSVLELRQTDIDAILSSIYSQ